ncbi:MAG: enoyl-CoA hydratase/isomerase family protein [Solirubrobacteraceae bacterium]
MLVEGSYETLRIEPLGDRALSVTIDHPPINLFDAPLREEFDRLTRELATNRNYSVVVFKSANREFFVAHSDVKLFADQQTSVPKSLTLSWIHALVERLRTLPMVTIAQLEGCARGGGSELALSMDMRFAARGRVHLGQPEVGLGIIPGAGGTQRLPALMGRGRALEVILGGEDFDADLAERYGWINRALDADEIGPFVARLATRIASFPPETIAYAKVAVDAATKSPIPGLLEERHCFEEAIARPAASQRIRAFLEAGGQTRDYELDLGTRLADLNVVERKEEE